MKNLDFLNKLKQKGFLKLIEPSEEMSQSYLEKSDKCVKVAELAYEADIYENAVSEAYYPIYNSVLSLFFKCGIKCENHSASVILIRELFKLDELSLVFSEFKKDRIDNQYYIVEVGTRQINKEKCFEKIKISREFNIKIMDYRGHLKLDEINKLRKLFEEI